MRLSPDLRDRFGQRLGSTEPLRFEVGPARPQLDLPGRPGLVRRLSARPELTVRSAGVAEVQVRIKRVQARDWPSYQALSRRGRDPGPLPGESVFDGAVAVDGPPGVITETRLDLSPALDAGLGHALVEVRAELDGRPAVDRRWVVVSDVLLDAFSDADHLHVIATDPEGAPLADRVIRLEPGGPRARTDAQGRARLPLPAAPLANAPWIEADDAGFLTDGGWSRGRDFTARPVPARRLVAWVTDDRGLYRPGERVHLKGFLRRFGEAGGLSTVESGR